MSYRRIGAWAWRFEFKPQDLWLGVFWKRENHVGYIRSTLDIWVCVLPMIPLHLLREYTHGEEATP